MLSTTMAAQQNTPGQVGPVPLRAVSTPATDSDLNELLAGHPDLMLGSYPEFSNPEYKVKVTLESKDRGYLDAAVGSFLGRLPKEAIVRVER